MTSTYGAFSLPQSPRHRAAVRCQISITARPTLSLGVWRLVFGDRLEVRAPLQFQTTAPIFAGEEVSFERLRFCPYWIRMTATSGLDREQIPLDPCGMLWYSTFIMPHAVPAPSLRHIVEMGFFGSYPEWCLLSSLNRLALPTGSTSRCAVLRFA